MLVLIVSALIPRVGCGGDFDLGAFGLGGPDSGFPEFEQKEKPLLQATAAPEFDVIAPGVPFKLLLTLDHAHGYYSYWRNPGGPGVGTSVEWILPLGFSISAPQWPAPERYENSGMVSYIYKGKVTVVYTVIPSREIPVGETFLLEGKLATQVCTPRSCNPLRQDISVSLASGDRPEGENPAVDQAEAALPPPPKAWRFEAMELGEELVVAMYPAIGSNPSPEGLYFFDDGLPQPLVDSQKPQALEKDGGVWWLRIPRVPGPSRVGERLDGVLYAENGWLEGDAALTGFEIDLPIAADAAGRPPGLQRAVSQETWLLLVFAFLGGLLLNVMPCVFPVIGLKIMGFAKQAHKDRRAIFLHGLAYTAGVLICFWTLSFLVITMGRGWGAQLQSDWFMFALCHIFMIMSMNMAGVFEVGVSVAGAGQALNGREGVKRSFFTGLLATITSTPCSAPFLGTALAYALSLPPLLSLGVFTLMGLGFSFPYLALSLFPSWLKKLPKPGPWMETFRQAMCFPLFATTAYLFWTMEAMIGEWRFLMLLFGLVMTAMACWLYGKHQKSQTKRPRAARVLMGSAVLALACGLWLGMPRASNDLPWEEWSPETVSRLREEGRPVYVDFTARWCATCQLNKRVYQNPELADLLRNKNVALLKADWTQYDDRITSTLKNEFNKAAVPVTVVYAPGERRASVLPDILTVENVSEVIGSLPDWVAAKP